MTGAGKRRSMGAAQTLTRSSSQHSCMPIVMMMIPRLFCSGSPFTSKPSCSLLRASSLISTILIAFTCSADAFSLTPNVLCMPLYSHRPHPNTQRSVPPLMKQRFLSKARRGIMVMQSSKDGAMDVDKTIDDVMKDINKYIDKYVFVRDVSADDAAEMRAAALVAKRKYRREISAGSNPQNVGEVRTNLLENVKDILVNQQDLIGLDEWDKLLKGFSQDSRQGFLRSVCCLPHITDLPESMFEGEASELETPPVNAGPSAFGVFFDIMVKDHPVEVCMWQSCAIARDEVSRFSSCLVEQPPHGSEKSRSCSPARVLLCSCLLTSARLCKLLTHTAKVSICKEGSGRGKELDGSCWEVLGSGEVSLPMVSWMDANPKYGDFPCTKTVKLKVLSEFWKREERKGRGRRGGGEEGRHADVCSVSDGVRVQAGETRGVCIHTNDIGGLIIRMTKDVALDSDFLDQDFGGSDADGDEYRSDKEEEKKARHEQDDRSKKQDRGRYRVVRKRTQTGSEEEN
eukprot:756319-Hanusia_phi.AAC.3